MQSSLNVGTTTGKNRNKRRYSRKLSGNGTDNEGLFLDVLDTRTWQGPDRDGEPTTEMESEKSERINGAVGKER